MSSSPYGVWRLGEARHDDELVSLFGRLSDALKALETHQSNHPAAVFEIRQNGRRVELDDGVPLHKRSTRTFRKADGDEEAHPLDATQDVASDGGGDADEESA